jgi:hypothetical protein
MTLCVDSVRVALTMAVMTKVPETPWAAATALRMAGTPEKNPLAVAQAQTIASATMTVAPITKAQCLLSPLLQATAVCTEAMPQPQATAVCTEAMPQPKATAVCTEAMPHMLVVDDWVQLHTAGASTGSFRRRQLSHFQTSLSSE